MTPRVLLVVPTYDNPEAIAPVVASLLADTVLPVLVVDDGSTSEVKAALRRAGIEDSRLEHLRHDHNRGKGAALASAFKWALKKGFTHVLSIDGDGQHLASELPRLIDAAEREPFALIIGARTFAGDHVPGVSRFGREFSNFWVHFQTGVKVTDSQSGMRLYPLFPVQTLAFFSTRYEFEIEILTRLLWAEVKVVEVPIAVHYPKPEERVSHFRKFHDNVRISLLNTVLVAWSLFTRQTGGKKLALATAAGAGVAALPLGPAALFGTLALATVLLRVNAWIMLLWYSASLLLPAAAKVCLPLAGGPLALALVAVGRQAARRPTKTWTGISRGGRFGNFFLRTVSRHVGRGATYFCLAFITPYFYLFAPRAKRSSLEFFAAARPETSWAARRVHVLRHFFTFGMILLDRLFQSFHDDTVFSVEVKDRALFDAAADRGKGVILLTAHVGGWDLSTRALVNNHLDHSTVIAEFVADAAVTSNTTVRAGDRNPLERASVHSHPMPILAYKAMLDEGKVVGIMGDRPMSAKLELVPFLGRLAVFDLTPFRLALSVGAPLLYAFAFKTGYGTYELTLEESRDLSLTPSSSKEEVAAAAVRHFAEALERHIVRHPHQWFNFYPFFSRPLAV